MHFIDISSLFSGNGFGINTNILETNVINLAVVIAVVISFVGDALRELLENRKQKIFDNISLADARVQEMEQRISDAKTQLEKAKQRASQIREQGILAAKQEKESCISQAEMEATRLKQLKDDSIRLQQQKAIQNISQQIVTLSVQKAHENLTKRMKLKSFQRSVNRGKMVKYVKIIESLVA
jgi:F-type H+-transporting ATPase subunit b